MTEFADKARSIGVSLKRGKSERKPVVNQDTGEVGGFHVERWDDSQDAHIIVKPVKARGKVQEG